jgi:hypothetical protein
MIAGSGAAVEEYERVAELRKVFERFLSAAGLESKAL